jgi:hypothetical protein
MHGTWVLRSSAGLPRVECKDSMTHASVITLLPEQQQTTRPGNLGVRGMPASTGQGPQCMYHTLMAPLHVTG